MPGAGGTPPPASHPNDPREEDPVPAPRVLRLLAAAVDGLLAVLVVCVAAWRAGVLGSGVVPLGVFAAAILVLFALRDVPSGASLAKWLLGLRVTTSAGTTPRLGSRLLRAPWSATPLAWLFPALERRTPWRVVAYVPSAAGLAVRLTLAAIALGLAGVVGFAALRPGIGRDDALHLARTTIASDPLLPRTIGAPFDVELGRILPRRAVANGAAFEVELRGPHARQNMTVVARRVGGAWAVDEVIDIAVTAPDTAPSMAGGSRARGGSAPHEPDAR
jgi:hypothetical protein